MKNSLKRFLALALMAVLLVSMVALALCVSTLALSATATGDELDAIIDSCEDVLEYHVNADYLIENFEFDEGM